MSTREFPQTLLIHAAYGDRNRALVPSLLDGHPQVLRLPQMAAGALVEQVGGTWSPEQVLALIDEGVDVGSKKVAVLEVSSVHPELVAFADKHVAQVRFALCVQDPISLLSTELLDHVARNTLTLPVAQRFIERILTDGWAVPAVDPNKLRAVRAEDLCTQPLDALQALTTWLDLDWDDCLTLQTHGGEPVEAPYSLGMGNNPIVLDDFDALRIRGIMNPMLAQWGYDTADLHNELDTLAATLCWPFRFYRYVQATSTETEQLAMPWLQVALARSEGSVPTMVPLLSVGAQDKAPASDAEGREVRHSEAAPKDGAPTADAPKKLRSGLRVA